MPLYEFECPECQSRGESIQQIGDSPPTCSQCLVPMSKLISAPAMVKVKGEGGYPSRRKFVKGTAPYTSRKTKAWLSEDPYDNTIDYMGTQKER